MAAPAVLRHAAAAGRPPPAAARYALLYGMGLSCVFIWRGTWVLWDVAYERLTAGAFTRPLFGST